MVNLDNAVAVVADGYWQAKQALAQIDVQWSTTGHENVSSETLFAQFENDMQQARKSGSAKEDFAVGDAVQCVWSGR